MLNVFARPNRLGRDATSFPEGLESRAGAGDLYCLLKGGTLSVFARLVKDGEVVGGLDYSHAGNPQIRWCGPAIGRWGNVYYELEFIVTLLEPTGVPPADVRERGSGFASGGLPSLGKRR